jgi:hypothetical protein
MKFCSRLQTAPEKRRTGTVYVPRRARRNKEKAASRTDLTVNNDD